MSKQNTNVALIQFDRKKLVESVEATARQSAAFVMGEELGATSAKNDVAWHDALKACRIGTRDRIMLRAGFVSTYAPTLPTKSTTKGTPEERAGNRFDYLARIHAPHTSRKAAHNAKRKAGGGRKEKTATGGAEQVNASAIAQRLAAVLHYIAKAQQDRAGDSEMLEVLGEIAAIAGGAKPKK